MRRAQKTVVTVCVAMILCLVTGCGDDGTSPGNRAPVISSMTANPSTVDPSGSSEISCTVSDRDGDSLSYAWDADDGMIDGSGQTIIWTSPLTAGRYAIWVTVSDGRGKSASDTVLADVRQGSLLIRTTGGLIAVDMHGNSSLFHSSAANVEVLGTRIFTGRSSILELDHQGNLIATIPVPPEVPEAYNFVVLPGAGFAFLGNATDTISIVDAEGNFITKFEIPGHDFDHSQNISGITIGNRLIVSENGAKELIEVDLTTYAAGIYRDLAELGGWPGDLDYSNGIFYICQCTRVATFTEASDPLELFSVDAGCITAVAVVGSYAYTVVNSPGVAYKTDIKTGETEIFAEGLGYPQDIEFIPVDLVE